MGAAVAAGAAAPVALLCRLVRERPAWTIPFSASTGCPSPPEHALAGLTFGPSHRRSHSALVSGAVAASNWGVGPTQGAAMKCLATIAHALLWYLPPTSAYLYDHLVALGVDRSVVFAAHAWEPQRFPFPRVYVAPADGQQLHLSPVGRPL